jgi:N6-L-threonylcarbamoyladenine synthase
MPRALGIDTSNYCTSAALYCGDETFQTKRLLPVADGTLGLRQSEALFLHIKYLGDVIENLMTTNCFVPDVVAASYAPTSHKSSYMPCFLSGLMAGRAIAASLRVPFFEFSHQTGHIASVILDNKRFDLLEKRFLSFHLSGGTTDVLLVDNLKTETITKIGGTADLNAGQLVDRVGNMLGLSFPAGCKIDELSLKSNRSFNIKPVIKSGKVCLSGFENKCRHMLEQGEAHCDIAKYAIQAIEASLMEMIVFALDLSGCNELVFAGGVMSNTILKGMVRSRFNGITARPEYSCDNAAGIAFLASFIKT